VKTRFMLAFGTVSASIALLAFAGPGLADPPDTLVSPPNHRHFIVTSDGMVAVGPQICGNPEMQQAFNAFHYNVHHSEVPGIGDIPTLGPQDGAPGLHNGRGAELVGVRGCG
jgi:hypothetical protein